MHQEFTSQVLMSLPQMIVHAMDSSSPLQPNGAWYDARGIEHQSPTATEAATQVDITHSHFYQQRELQAFLSDRQAEIVVLVEGTDELTGAAIQARHSYTHS